MNDWTNVLGALGICLKAKKLAVGDEAATDFFRQGHARLILLPRDAGQSIRRKAAFWEGKSPAAAVAEIPCTSEELGRALGRRTCSICCVSDAGFAASLSAKLAGVSEENRLAAEKMSRRKERIDKRKNKKHKPEAYAQIEKDQRKTKKNCGGAC